MNNSMKGSMETLSAMQVTSDTEGQDIQSKTILCHPEVLAVILRDTAVEYKDYSWQEIREFIEADTITSTMEVSPGRTNTPIRKDSTEYYHLNEKTSNFDLAFRARNPQLSTKDIQVNLHIDVEPQKTYKTDYPIEKRGMYYLSRRLSSQLSLVLQGTDYNQLSKCYSIFICRDDIPKEERYSIAVYEMMNTKNTAQNAVARENYDLMTLIVIKLGDEVYNGDKEEEGYVLFRFLNLIMYPHKDDFMVNVSEYIDYSDNEELWKEVTDVSTIEQIKYEGMKEKLTKELTEQVTKDVTEQVTRELTEQVTKDVTEQVTKDVTEQVTKDVTEQVTKDVTEQVTKDVTDQITKEGIRIFILSSLEDDIPEERILAKLQKHYHITKEKAEQYYREFTAEI